MNAIVGLTLLLILAGGGVVHAQDDDYDDRPDGYLFKLNRNPAMIAAQIGLALQKARDTLDVASTITRENAATHADQVYESYVLIRYAEAEIAANGQANKGRTEVMAKMRVKWLNKARTELRRAIGQLQRQTGPDMPEVITRLTTAVQMLEDFSGLCC
jgi:hypothetical protein